MSATPQKGEDISLQFYCCIIIEFKGRKPVIFSQVVSVAHVFCGHIGLEVLLKLKKSKGNYFIRVVIL